MHPPAGGTKKAPLCKGSCQPQAALPCGPFTQGGLLRCGGTKGPFATTQPATRGCCAARADEGIGPYGVPASPAPAVGARIARPYTSLVQGSPLTAAVRHGRPYRPPLQTRPRISRDGCCVLPLHGTLPVAAKTPVSAIQGWAEMGGCITIIRRGLWTNTARRCRAGSPPDAFPGTPGGGRAARRHRGPHRRRDR